MDSTQAFEANANIDAQLDSNERRAMLSGGQKAHKDPNASHRDESTPLLHDPSVPPPYLLEDDIPTAANGNGGAQDDDEELDEFAGLPWYKRPSVFWLIPPFAIYALAFGGSVVPKLDLTIDLVCRHYLATHSSSFEFTSSGPFTILEGGDICRKAPEIKAATSNFTLMTNLLSGIIAAITSPKLGHWSDRRGRKLILALTSSGTLVGEIIFILAASYPETISIYWILVSSVFDGLCGSFIAALAVSFAYTSDSHPPKNRNIKFSYLYGCFFAGIGLGPIISGLIVKASGKLITMMYIALAFHTAYIVFLLLFVPESLSKARKEAAERKYELQRNNDGQKSWADHLREANILSPLKILFPTGKGTSRSLRTNLLLLASVDTITFGVAMGSVTIILIYSKGQFDWDNFETSKFVSIVNCCRVFMLLVVLPLATKLIRNHVAPPPPNSAGSDVADIWLIRAAILFDTLGYLGYCLSRRGELFVLSGVVSSLGGIGSPTISSSLTKHVPPDRTGQMMGAMGLLHSLARVIAPTLFHGIFSLTVGKFDQTVFVCLCATFGVAFVLCWFIRPYVYFDEPEDPTANDQHEN